MMMEKQSIEALIRLDFINPLGLNFNFLPKSANVEIVGIVSMLCLSVGKSIL